MGKEVNVCQSKQFDDDEEKKCHVPKMTAWKMYLRGSLQDFLHHLGEEEWKTNRNYKNVSEGSIGLGALAQHGPIKATFDPHAPNL